MCFSSHCLNNFAANRISNLELLVLEESHRQSTQRKKISRSKEPTKNSAHMMLGLKPRTLWWELSVLTAAQALGRCMSGCPMNSCF